MIRYRRIIIVALLLMLVPLLYAVLSFAARSAPQDTWLEPARPGTTCVLGNGNQRYDHMKQLKSLRDEVMREGKRAQITGTGAAGLGTCSNCHAHRELFCDKCHNRASVSIDCFGCHTY